MALSSGCYVRIADDKMSAELFLASPSSDEEYSADQVLDFIRNQGVIYGIDASAVKEMVDNRIYNRNFPIALGRAVVHGVSGSYEFFFEQDRESKRPQIRSDGSVDYQSMSLIHNVRVGDILAVYHPAVQGTPGMDVTGRETRANIGKELPKLSGSGFDLSPDGNTYTAAMEGKIEYDNYKLFVRDVYEFRGDLDLIVGKIDFRGDVIVHGNVCAGTVIRASRSIAVEGNAEAATLIADGDIILNQGMQGARKARILSGGSVYANFLEFTTVEAKENVEANIIMNCRVSAGKDIVVSGKRGAIVGGEVYCVSAIRSNLLGNPAGMKTVAAVGMSREMEQRNHLLQMKAEATKRDLGKTLIEIEQMKASGMQADASETKEARWKQLERRKIRDERLLAHVTKELSKLDEILRISSASVVQAGQTAYRGSVIRIGDQEKTLLEDMNHVEFFRDNLMEGIQTRAVVTT